MILIETGYHEKNAKGNPDPGPHSVFTSAVKGLDAEFLLGLSATIRLPIPIRISTERNG